jgi:type IV secretory pathway TrbL component
MTVIGRAQNARRVLVAITIAAAITSSAAAATAAQAAAPRASCVGTITSYEGSQLAPGSVGVEVSGLATSGPGFGSGLVGPLAHHHLGSIETCFEAEG